MGYLQGRVDEAYTTMVSDIALGRGRKVSEVRDGFGEGRVVSATAAKRMGMIDRIATFDQAIERLSQRRVNSVMKAEAGDTEPLAEAPSLETPVVPDSVINAASHVAEGERDDELRERLDRL
jgi:ClpP class serine protease